MAKCMITGCVLEIAADFDEAPNWLWGDLFEEGDCWIFNATGEFNYTRFDDRRRMITVSGNSYFECRNVFVCKKSSAHLNLVARQHIAKFEGGSIVA